MKKRVQKNKVRKKIQKFIIMAIIGLYFATKIFPLFTEANNKTYVVSYGRLEETVPVIAYIIRDEKVISRIQDYSNKELLVQEGKMVAKGQVIARFHLADDRDSKIEKDLRSIESRIENIKEQQTQTGIFQSDINKIDDQIQSKVNLIQTYINDGEFEKIYSLKNNINSLLEKKSVISGSNSFTGINLAELENQRSQLRNKLNSYIKVVTANSPGYVAYGSDGLEDLFNLSNIENLNFESFKMLKEKNNLNENEMAIRIINNFRYNLVIELDNKQMSGIEEGRFVRLRDNNSNNSNREFRARIRKIVSDEDEQKSLVILSVTEHMENIFSNRILEVDLLKNVYEGITVPNKSIIEIDGQVGVFKVDINGFIGFVPIKIKGQNDDYSIVHNSHFDSLIDGESKRVITITSFDEIVLSAEGLNEGQKIR